MYQRFVRLSILMTVTILFASSAVAMARTRQVQARFAVVDLERVNREFRGKQNAKSIRMLQILNDQISRRNEMPFLTEIEHLRLDKIMAKPSARQSQRERTEVRELYAKSDRLNQDYALSKNRVAKEGTEQDNQTVRKLDEIVADANRRSEAQKSQKRKITSIVGTESDKIISTVRSAVKKVAQSKHIDVVFSASQVAVVASGPMDITDDVIAELNKRR